jgi:outer membrane protein assembly factor BamB
MPTIGCLFSSRGGKIPARYFFCLPRSLLVVDLSAGFRCHLCWILTGCLLSFTLGLPGLSAAEPVPKTKLAVSSFALDAISLTPPTTKEFAAGLSSETWCTAVPAETKGAWSQLPAGVDRKEWVSVVTVGFNGQAETYLFMFNGADGAMSMATHVPFREVWLPSGAAAWIWPADSVMGALRISYQNQRRSQQDSSEKKSGKRPLSLSIIPWETADSDVLAPPTKTPDLGDARTLSPEQVLPAVEVMTHAAAFEAGWMPRVREAGPIPADDSPEYSAICEVKVEDQACSFRLKLRAGKSEQTFTKLHVPWETYHEHLVRLFRYVDSGAGVSDFTQLARLPVEPLALNEGRLACLVNHELTVFDLATGKKIWTTQPAVKPVGYYPVPQYTTAAKADGGERLIRYRPSLSELSWDAGKLNALAPVAADAQHRFSINGDGDFATSNSGTVSLHHQGKLRWEQKEPDGVSSGPLLTANQVIYGQTTGRLVARSATNGQLVWTGRMSGALYGKIVAAGDSLLVFSNAAEALVALDAATGAVQWQNAVGDVLLETPVVIGTQVLLVTKSNRILLIDLATGAVKKETTWPTWLVSVSLINTRPAPMLACSDLAGTVSLLSLADLKVTREIRVAAQLAGPVLYTDKISYKWPIPKAPESEENLLAEIKDGPTQAGPALLAADAQGFLYIIPLTSPE